MTLLAALLQACVVIVLLAPNPARARLDRVVARRTRAADSAAAARQPTGFGSTPDVDKRTQRSNRPHLASPRARLTASVLAALAASTYASGWFAPVAGCGVGIAAWVILSRLVAARPATESEAVATALTADLLLSAIRAGCSPVTAAEIVGAALGGGLGDALTADSSAARMGAGVHAWRETHRNQSWRPLARALRASMAHGTSPRPALERVARDARDGARWDGEARARAVGARAAAPLGLCFLPAFVLVAIVPIIVTSFQ